MPRPCAVVLHARSYRRLREIRKMPWACPRGVSRFLLWERDYSTQRLRRRRRKGELLFSSEREYSTETRPWHHSYVLSDSSGLGYYLSLWFGRSRCLLGPDLFLPA